MPQKQDEHREVFGKTAFGALLVLAWLFLAAAVLSYTPWDFPTQFVYHDLQEVRNIAGLPGAWCAYAISLCFGVGSYFLLLALGFGVVLYWFNSEVRDLSFKTVGLTLMLISISGGAAYLFGAASDPPIGPPIGPGGCVGALVKYLFDKVFAPFGACVALLGVFLAGLTLVVPDSVLRLVVWSSGLGKASSRVFRPFRVKIERARPRQALTSPTRVAASPPARVLTQVDRTSSQPRVATAYASRSQKLRAPELRYSAISASPQRTPQAVVPTVSTLEAPSEPRELVVDTREAFAADTSDVAARPASIENAASVAALSAFDEESDDYVFPPLELLDEAEFYDYSQIEDQIRARGEILEASCKEFKVDVQVVDYRTGPVLTMYEIQPSKGLSVKKIESIERDLAVKLAAGRVRIVSPLPGKTTVGVETPNKDRINVKLREVMEAGLEESDSMTLPLFLGKDVVGAPMIADLAKLPHLLIAGSTGSGKSVCLNTIIMSLIMTRSPKEVKMIMIDPKMVELSPYNHIPHLMHPVVTDMEKATAILEWAVEKMEARYRILESVGVRNLKDFNALPIDVKRRRLKTLDDDEWREFPKTMASIVLIIDEFADLIMTVGKDVEKYIQRLAQKSRAVGIHLVLATQRPTRNVVTGTIKANLPARITFQVSCRTDSLVVLDATGADKLLGHGDMLFKPANTDELTRGQGAFVSDDEIRAVLERVNVEHPNYEVVIADKDHSSDDDFDGVVSYDPLYIQCVDFVISEGKASGSMLQRKYSIGYNRAGKIIDMMTEEGLVSKPNPAKPSSPRKVLVTMEQWRGRRDVIEDSASPLIRKSSEFVAKERSNNAGDATINGSELDENNRGYEEIDLAPNPPKKRDPQEVEQELEREKALAGNAPGWSDAQWEQYLDYESELDN